MLVGCIGMCYDNREFAGSLLRCCFFGKAGDHGGRKTGKAGKSVQVGLASVSFRPFTAEQVVALSAKLGLQMIEWGGDIHVPAGDLDRAREAAALTRKEGIGIGGYGSYYRIGTYSNPIAEWTKVLDTAVALGTPCIGVWAYNRNKSSLMEREYRSIVVQTREICEMAKKAGLRVALECHPGTITGDYRDSLQFLEDIGYEATMYWQPNQFQDGAYNLRACQALAPHVTYVHVFHWGPKARYPLAAGEREWSLYRDILNRQAKEPDYVLKYMPDNMAESLPRETKALRKLLQK